MEKIQNISDISKETLAYLAFFDNDMIEKIPGYVIAKLCEEAADSKLDFYINPNKNFEEQEISEKSKDLISLIYYEYIANESEKKEILHKWNLNEKEYQNLQKEKYNYNNLFSNENNTCVELVKVKEKTIFQKINKIIKKIFGPRRKVGKD